MPDPVEPSIRPATLDDIDAIVEIAMRAWEPIWEERAGVLGEELMRADCGGDPRERKAENLRGHCEWDLSTVYVTELNGQVVGFITFAPFWDNSILEIANNAVDPEYQGRGLGAAQYEHVLVWGRAKGLKYAKVTTGLDECHAPARAAYKRVGFDRSIPSVTYYMEL